MRQPDLDSRRPTSQPTFEPDEDLIEYDFPDESPSAPDTARQPALDSRQSAQPSGQPTPDPDEADPSDPDKPTIVVSCDEEGMTREAVDALVRAKRGIYQRSGLLVHVCEERTKLSGVTVPMGTPTIEQIPSEVLSLNLSSSANWTKPTRTGPVPTHPPDKTVKQVMSYSEAWERVPCLDAVIECPILRPNGTVLDKPGYDDETGILFCPNGRFEPIPSTPSLSDAKAAVQVLADAVCDFPFAGPEHRSSWLAGLLTHFARYAFEGCAPLNLIDAPEKGTGKSLLADLQGEIVSGRKLPIMPQSREEEEVRKRVMALALGGVRAVLLDNFTHLGGPVLDMALTSTSITDRILGVSKVKSLPLLITWVATGNNVVLVGDMSRRVNLTRLEPDCERPDARSGFRHDPLLPWVRRNRGRLVAAALTILRAYCAAGRPHVRLPSWGSFEAWSGLVRAALVWAGEPDPYLARARLDESDAHEAGIGVLFGELAKLFRTFGDGRGSMSAGVIAETLRDDPHEHGELLGAIGDLVQPQGGKGPSGREIGYLLRKYRDKIRGGLRLVQTPPIDGYRRWRFVDVSSGRKPPSGDSGDSGDAGGRPGVDVARHGPHDGGGSGDKHSILSVPVEIPVALEREERPHDGKQLTLARREVSPLSPLSPLDTSEVADEGNDEGEWF